VIHGRLHCLEIRQAHALREEFTFWEGFKKDGKNFHPNATIFRETIHGVLKRARHVAERIARATF
jgi:hypothetical protein